MDMLKNILDFFKEYSGALVAFSTVIYAYLTWKLVKETRKMREAQTEPKISVTIQPKEGLVNLIDLIIQNIGLGPAYNIKFEINPDFEYTKGKFLSETGFIKKGLSYLAPNQKLQSFLTNMLEDTEQKINNPFEIKVIYQNSVGRTYEDVYLIDFSQWLGLTQITPPLHEIARSLEKLQENLSTGLKCILVTKK